MGIKTILPAKNQEMQEKDDPYEAQKWIDEYVAVQKRMGKSVPTRNFLTLF